MTICEIDIGWNNIDNYKNKFRTVYSRTYFYMFNIFLGSLKRVTKIHFFK